MSDEQPVPEPNESAANSADTESQGVTAEDVRHVAQLARIDLSETEIDRFTEQFEGILSYFETLDSVPETDREPDLVNVLRSDDVEDGLDREVVLENAAESEDGYFKGPRVS